MMKRKLPLLVGAFAMCMVLGLLLGGKVHALAGEATNDLPNNGSATPWLIITRPGGNGMDAPHMSTIVYSVGSSFRMNINDACDGTSHDDQGWANDTTYSFDSVSSVSIAGGTGTVTNIGTNTYQVACTGGINLTLDITMAPGAAQQTIHTGPTTTVTYNTVNISADLTDPDSAAYYTNRFRFYSDSDTVVFGYAATTADPGLDTSEYTGIAYDKDGSNSWGWSTSIAFAPPCDMKDPATLPVWFYDTDDSNKATSSSPYWQNNNHHMHYSLQAYDRVTRTPVGSPVTGDLIGGNNVADRTEDFTFSSDRVYTIEISDVNYVNSIQVALPFEQIYASDQCQPATPPTISCELTSGSPVIEPGENYTPQAKVTYNSGTPDAPGVDPLNVAFHVGSTDLGTAAGTLANGSSTTLDAPNSFTASAVGDYTVSATASGTAGSFSVGPTDCGTTTLHVATKPYFKVYGADVRAGGSFVDGAGNCALATSGGVYGFAKQDGGSWRGASSQFGIMALLNVNGAFSTSLRTSNNSPAVGATFANVSGVANSDPVFGGGFGKGACVPDYYGGFTGSGTVADLNTALATGLSGSQRLTGTTLVANGATITVPGGRQLALYAGGDVYIGGNIVYAANARTQLEDIPYFALIVQGNIYIGPGVTRLDGLFIAQPSNAANGRIYTCARNLHDLYASNELPGACGSQLVINGGLVAQQVKFLRTFKSLKDSTAGEAPNFSNGTGTNAAEIINYSPELYMAPSPLKDPNTASGTTKYDAIFSLPPIF